MALAPSCVFCFAELTKLNERNLVASRGEFNVGQQLESLPFIIHTEISKYICRKCLGLIKKRSCLKQKLEELEKDLLSEYRSQCHQRGIPLKVKSPSKRWTPDVDKPIDQPVLGDGTAYQTSCSPILRINKRDQASQTDPLPITKSSFRMSAIIGKH